MKFNRDKSNKGSSPSKNFPARFSGDSPHPNREQNLPTYPLAKEEMEDLKVYDGKH